MAGLGPRATYIDSRTTPRQSGGTRQRHPRCRPIHKEPFGVPSTNPKALPTRTNKTLKPKKPAKRSKSGGLLSEVDLSSAPLSLSRGTFSLNGATLETAIASSNFLKPHQGYLHLSAYAYYRSSQDGARCPKIALESPRWHADPQDGYANLASPEPT